MKPFDKIIFSKLWQKHFGGYKSTKVSSGDQEFLRFLCKIDPSGWSHLLRLKSQMNHSWVSTIAILHIPQISVLFTLDSGEALFILAQRQKSKNAQQSSILTIAICALLLHQKFGTVEVLLGYCTSHAFKILSSSLQFNRLKDSESPVVNYNTV